MGKKKDSIISLSSTQGEMVPAYAGLPGQHPLHQIPWEAPLWCRGGGEESLCTQNSSGQVNLSASGRHRWSALGTESCKQVIRRATSYSAPRKHFFSNLLKISEVRMLNTMISS